MIAPKLRFSEFKDEWIELSLKEYYSKIRNGFVGVATPFYVENGIKYLQGKNIKVTGTDSAVGIVLIDEKGTETKLPMDMIAVNNPSEVLVLLPAAVSAAV